MGEIAEMILEGILCQYCGEVMPDVSKKGFIPPGFPRTCKGCLEDEVKDEVKDEGI